MKYYLDLGSLLNQLHNTLLKCLILNNKSDDTLARIGEVHLEMVDDGMTVQL